MLVRGALPAREFDNLSILVAVRLTYLDPKTLIDIKSVNTNRLLVSTERKTSSILLATRFPSCYAAQQAGEHTNLPKHIAFRRGCARRQWTPHDPSRSYREPPRHGPRERQVLPPLRHYIAGSAAEDDLRLPVTDHVTGGFCATRRLKTAAASGMSTHSHTPIHQIKSLDRNHRK
jgi:hypothetical protein